MNIYKFIYIFSASEPEALLQDIYSVLANTNHNKVWLRNIFKDNIGDEASSLSSSDTCDTNPWQPVQGLAQDCQSLEGTPYPTLFPALSPDGSNSRFKIRKNTNDESIATASKGSIMTAEIIILVLGLAVILVIIWYLYHAFTAKGIISLAASHALGTEGQKMDTATMPNKNAINYQRYTQASTEAYTQAAGDSEHGVMSSAHGGVVSSSITPISGILGSPSPPSRSAPELETAIISPVNRGIWGFLFPFRPNRYSYN